jgi:predicted unusual protein kinase regulating ubiquinone biosynthesis (AarF/ABC1/UbiB family)
MAKKTDKKIDKIRSGVFERSLSLAKMAVSSGSRLTALKVTDWVTAQDSDAKAKTWNKFLVERAQSLGSELGELKGSLMKAGQMLSMFGEYFLPPEANEFLKTLYNESPALDFSEIEKILKQEWPNELLARIQLDPKPIGSASIGQVHRGKILATGEYVAVKVQYAGIDKAIASDIKALRTILSMMKVVPREMNLEAAFQEIRSMLEQEMNYEIEATATEKYKEKLAQDDRFVVPRVYREFSTKKVLVTSYEPGLSPDDPAISALDQERRNRLAQNFLDLYLLEFFQWGFVQTDPHLGNYKIRLKTDSHGKPQDQLVLLDFGAVRNYEPEFLAAYKKMIFASLDNQAEDFFKFASELRFLKGSEGQPTKQQFFELCKLIVEPFQGQVFDYKNSDLPKRTTAAAMKLISSFKVSNPPHEVIFLDRKTGGVFIMMVVLAAKFNPRPQLMKYKS